MQRRDDSALRVVVVDYQRCAFAPENRTDEQFLSPKLIAFLLQHKYDFFIGHTFRCIINIDTFRDTLLNDVPPSEQAKFLENFPTVKITEHLAARTKTDCMAVSTLDDLVTKQVGQGYDDLVNYEMSGVITQNKHVQPDQEYDLMKQNNSQLLLIAQDIALKHPGKAVQLDIIDDDLRHCNQAASADQQADWPQTVKLNNIYRFDTKLLNDQVSLISSPDSRAIVSAAAPRKQSKPQQQAVPQHRPLTNIPDDTAYAASVLVTGTFGTFSRPAAPQTASAAAAAATPQEPRRSERLAAKGRVRY